MVARRAETQGQAALHGVLAQIETLGLELLEVRRLQAAGDAAAPSL